MISLWIAFLSAVVACAACLPAGGVEMTAEKTPVLFHVSPAGRDSWSGRLAAPAAGGADGPLATPEAAVLAARKEGAAQPRKVVIAQGQYFLARPLALEAGDSGLSIEAAPGAKVTLIGGRRLTGWRKDGDKFYAIDLPEVKAGKWDFRTLTVNGSPRGRARRPEEGFFEHRSEFDVPWMSTTGGGWKRKPTPEELTTLVYDPRDLGPWLDARSAEITIYHSWDESLVGLRSAVTDAGKVSFSESSPASAAGIQPLDVSGAGIDPQGRPLPPPTPL